MLDATTKQYLTDEQIETFFETPRKKRRRERKEKNETFPELNDIKPLTRTQKEIFETFWSCPEQNIFLHGYAGTGKSFISCYLLMRELLESDIYKKLVIVRSTTPSRDQGFLPGNAADKAKIYEKPYYAIFEDLFGRADAYDQMKKRKKVEFESTSYLRGNTFNDCLIFFDEFQNGTYHEIKTVLTRVGKNCRMIVSGDFHQSDLIRDNERKGVLDIIRILKKIECVDFFEFKKEDIVRSKFVKEFLIAESENKFATK